MQLFQGVRREIFRRRLVLLDAFQIANQHCCLFFLFIDDALEVVELLIDFLTNFIFESFLITDLLLHLLGLLKVAGALHLDIFELLEMHV